MHFAQNLRAYRIKQSLSLRNLASLSNVSRTMLSDIENGKKIPTITVACRIANALGISLSTLMMGDDTAKRVVIIRKNERHSFVDPKTQIVRQSISSQIPASDIEITAIQMPAGTSTGLLPAHKSGGKVYLILTKGSISVRIGTESIGELKEGDSMYFEADIEHEILNAGSNDAEYLLVFRSVLI